MDAGTIAAWAGVAVALAGCILAALTARDARTKAQAAESRADRAIELAESAEARAQRLEAVQFERAEVGWELYWAKDEHLLVVRNVGLDAAHDVELVADPLLNTPARRKRTNEQVVEPTAFIGLDFGTVVGAATSPAARARARQHGADINLAVRVQVTWRTQCGTARTKTWAEVPIPHERPGTA